MAQTLVRDVDSRNAQLASVAVQMERSGSWEAFDRGLYEALWREGRDVGEPDVLAAVAADVGLDPDWIRSSLGDEMVRRRLEDQWEAARMQGITGVPTFVADGQTARGAIPPAQFERLFDG
jgi:predicted DsbA family dithiol-disulfide isomerase